MSRFQCVDCPESRMEGDFHDRLLDKIVRNLGHFRALDLAFDIEFSIYEGYLAGDAVRYLLKHIAHDVAVVDENGVETGRVLQQPLPPVFHQ